MSFSQRATGQAGEPPKRFLIDDNRSFIDINGQVVISASEPRLMDEVRRISTGLGGFRAGDEAHIWISFSEFSEGLAIAGWALCPMCCNSFWVNGIIDESGRLVIPPMNSYTRYESFHDGLAKYSAHGWGFIDRQGRVVIPARFYEAANFSEGLAAVRASDSSRFGYIKRDGELAIPYSFAWAGDFHDGLAAVAITKGRYGYIDKTGRVILQAPNWFEAGDFSEGLAAVQVEVVNDSVYRGYKDRKYAFIDRTGRFVISPQFDTVGKFSEGLTLFMQTGERHGYGFIDANGRVLVRPEYVDGKSFSEGLAAVAVKSEDEKIRWGYIDKEGHWAIRPQFQNANSFRGGLAAVNCDQYGARCRAYIDKAGSVRWPIS